MMDEKDSLDIDLEKEWSGKKKLNQKHMGKFRHAVIEKTFGYTNENNPFNDSCLSDPFIWKEKKKLLSAMGRVPKIRTPHVFINQTKQKIHEIKSVKKRREAREEEERLLEQQQAVLARERELENYAEWEAREEAFHRVMACRRTNVRLVQGRERPCDLIIKALRILDGEEFENLSLLPYYPHDLFHTLTPSDLKLFLDDISIHLNIARTAVEDPKAVELEKNWAQSLDQTYPNLFTSASQLASYLNIWESLEFLGKDVSHRLNQKQTPCSTAPVKHSADVGKTRDVSSGIAVKVLEDLDQLMKSKSLKELQDLETHIIAKRQAISQDPSSGADLSYWDAVIEKLPYYKAVATLKDMHDRAIARVKEILAVRRSTMMTSSTGCTQSRRPTENDRALVDHSRDKSPQRLAQNTASLTEDKVAWTPPLVNLETIKHLGLLLLTEEEFEKKREALKQELLIKYTKSTVLHPKQKPTIPPPPPPPSRVLASTLCLAKDASSSDLYDSFVAAEKPNMSVDEFLMTPADLVELPPSTSLEHWESKYLPRKPRFFNRVKTGYEWNKYNQTHYDRDNPPPKAVQGYKFNLFYPELIDKTKAPSWKLLPSDEPETILLRFHGGPPYQDVVFKIFNREWDINPRTGYRNVFDRGILQLHFNFKRYRYRR